MRKPYLHYLTKNSKLPSIFRFHSRLMKLKRLYLISLFLIIAFRAISSQWAQVRIPVACIRDGAGHSTEMTSQAILGTPLMILGEEGEWLHIQSPDGYEGYMNISSVERKTDGQMLQWRTSPRYVSISLQEVKLFGDKELTSSPRNIVTEIPLSSILEGNLVNDSVLQLTLPDGRTGFAKAKNFIEAEKWASQTLDPDAIVDRAYWLMGTPYLWGACSTKSVDCSGIVRVCYFANGVLTLRDARQQINIGESIPPESVDRLERGDLLFFSTTPEGRISHVAIYDSNGRYIHSSGLVKTNLMSAEDPDFSARCYRGASRIAGMVGTEGIIQMIDHPWYFEITK